MIRSMTGYARVRKSTALGEVIYSLKSVNHRGLDLHFNLPASLDAYEPALRAVLKRRLLRGHVELRVHIASQPSQALVAVNQELLAAYIGAFKEAAKTHRLDSEPDLNLAFRIPGMLTDAAAGDTESSAETTLVSGLEEACDQLEAFRQREGAELATEMIRRQLSIVSAALDIDRMRPAAITALQQRLNDRLAEVALKLDPQRIAQEVAILVERSDISEEIARLKIHAAELGELLAKGGEVGKKLDFMLQEMNRETNTILSKTSNAGEPGVEITRLGLHIKAEIEKIREQSLNVE